MMTAETMVITVQNPELRGFRVANCFVLSGPRCPSCTMQVGSAPPVTGFDWSEYLPHCLEKLCVCVCVCAYVWKNNKWVWPQPVACSRILYQPIGGIETSALVISVTNGEATASCVLQQVLSPPSETFDFMRCCGPVASRDACCMLFGSTPPALSAINQPTSGVHEAKGRRQF